MSTKKALAQNNIEAKFIKYKNRLEQQKLKISQRSNTFFFENKDCLDEIRLKSGINNLIDSVIRSKELQKFPNAKIMYNMIENLEFLKDVLEDVYREQVQSQSV